MAFCETHVPENSKPIKFDYTDMCEICDDSDVNLLILDCGHTLCQYCLINIEQNSKSRYIKCPFCSKEIFYPPIGLCKKG